MLLFQCPKFRFGIHFNFDFTPKLQMFCILILPRFKSTILIFSFKMLLGQQIRRRNREASFPFKDDAKKLTNGKINPVTC